MFGHADNNMLPEKAVLLFAMKGGAPLFEYLRIDSIKIKLDSLPNRKRRSKRRCNLTVVRPGGR